MCVVFLPNVGGAIVADEAGITRDRTYRPAEFLGEHFQVVDTGGLVFEDNDDIFSKDIRDQAMIAIDEACAVILVTDGMVGLTQMDIEVSAQGRTCHHMRYSERDSQTYLKEHIPCMSFLDCGIFTEGSHKKHSSTCGCEQM